jgi:hypothetical protein
VVTDDPESRTVTLTYDYTEGGGIWSWVSDQGAGTVQKRAMSVIFEENFVEVSRTNYFGLFPVAYEHLTGFSQPEKVKERVVISYDFSEPGT